MEAFQIAGIAFDRHRPRVDESSKDGLVSMSVDPNTHRQISGGRDPDSPKSTINRMSFNLASLDELREMLRIVRDRAKTSKPLNHGFS